MSTNVDVVQAQLEAYNKGDIDAFCSCYHPEISVKDLPDDQIRLRGLAAFRQHYAKLFETHPGQTAQLKSRIVFQESVIDEELIIGRKTHPQGLHAIAIYGFRDGLIDRVWFTK